MEADDDRALVDGLRRGDAAAFDRAYARYAPRLYAFLVRLSGRRDLAEDLLQDTWMRLAQRGARLREDSNLSAFLFTIARNLYLSHRRWTLLDRTRVDELAAHPPRSTGPAAPFDAAAASETHRRLEAALVALPPSYREALLLVAVERMEPSEAAAVVGIRADAFRQRLSRARAMLETALAAPAERTA